MFSPIFDQITSPPQAQAEVIVNEVQRMLQFMAVYAVDPATTTGLTLGYKGGRWGGYSVSGGTLALTASSTNYVVVNRSNGAISVSAGSTNWDNTTDYARVYKLPTTGSGIDWPAAEDHRLGESGIVGTAAAAAGGGGGSADGAGFKNTIINGAFLINQRAYASGAATTAGQYTFDRWKVTGTGGITFSTTSNKTTITIPSGQTLQQVIEGLNLQTGTYVLSWEGSAQGRIGAGSYGASGAVTASITGGVNTTIEFNAGTLSNVQLELDQVTAFEVRPYHIEFLLCARYYLRISSDIAYGPYCIGGLISTTTSQFYFQFPVPMRIAPTGVEASAASLFTVSTTAVLAVSSVAYAASTIRIGAVHITHAAGTVPNVCRLRGDAGSYIGFTGAEL